MTAQKLALLVALLPYLALSAFDGWMHEKDRRVPRVEQWLHAGLFVFASLAIYGAFTARPMLALCGLLAFAPLAAADEFGFHRLLAWRERRVHYLAYVSFAAFAGVALAHGCDAMGLIDDVHIAYALMVVLGVSLFLLVRPTRQYASAQRAEYLRLQAITFVAAIVGAKVAVVFGDALWPLQPFHDWAGLLWSGRSIIGALLFGFVAAEVAKPLLRYSLPPNDRFAVLLPFSLATGRVGCWFAGCCAGIESTGPFALVGVDGVSRIPAQLIELAFHLAAGMCLLVLWRRGRWPGQLFSVYLVAYGLFRFFSETWRVTPKAYAGLSAYQVFSLLAVVAGLTVLVLRANAARPVLQEAP